MKSTPSVRIGFTLVESLVALGIFALLLAILLPAIGLVRSRARQLQCLSQIREQSKAALIHEQAHGWFPSGGWGSTWTGIRDRGFGSQQPGGWIYNLLPYCDEEAIWKLAPRSIESPIAAEFEAFVSAVVPILICPERSGDAIIPVSHRFRPVIGTPISVAARTDYAINAGLDCHDTDNGPRSLAAGDAASYPWPDSSKCEGISFARSQIRMRDIRAGTSHVFLCGEKLAKPMPTTKDEGMNQPHVSGDSWDIRRVTAYLLWRDNASAEIAAFGSAHANGAAFSLCDGSAQFINYDMDPIVFKFLGMRNHRSTPSE